MKKNLRKLLSLLTALTIIFTMAGIPAMAEEVTVDFTAAENIAYGKKITPVTGSYYSGAPAPSATRQCATDGDINTYHSSYGKANGKKVGVTFYIDLEEECNITEFTLFVSQSGRKYKLYNGTSVDEANLLATVTTGTATTVNGKSGIEKLTATLPEGTKAQYLTVRFEESSGFPYNEIYIKGTNSEPEPSGTTVNFADKENIAYGKVVTSVSIGNWNTTSTGKAPSASNKCLTDGDLTTRISGDGDGGKPPTEGVKFKIDLEEECELTELILYGKIKTTNIYNGSYTADSSDGFKLKDANGNPAVPIVSGINVGEIQTINGTDIEVTTIDLTGVTARYLTFEYTGAGTYILNEIYLKKVYNPADELKISMLTTENKQEITKNLTLPSSLDNGATVEWKSSSSHIISNTGVVTAQKEDMPVMLTATITLNGKTYIKKFDFIVLKENTEYIAWTDYFNFDFIESERSSYKFVATDSEGYEIDGYFSNPENWEEEFLPDGGYRFKHLGNKSIDIPFAERLETDSSSSIFKISFTFKLDSLGNDVRWFITNTDDKIITTVFINKTGSVPYIAFGPTSNNADKQWFVNNIDYINEKVTVDIIYKNGYVYPYVNGVSAVRESDGSKCFKNTRGGQMSYVGFSIKTNAHTFYDFSMSKGADPTGDCNYSTITSEDSDKITQDLYLMDILDNGATVTWETSNPEVIATDGRVSRQQYDEKVTLTACITYNNQPLYKKFEFIVTAADKDSLNLILSHDDFKTNNRYFVKTVSPDSSVMIVDGKLRLTRISEGPLSAQKYFVSNLAEDPYIIEGEKMILEQYLTFSGDIDGGTSYIYNKDNEVLASYGFKTDNDETVFFVDSGEDEITVPYSRAQEIFVRIEIITDSRELNVLVNNLVITPTPLRLNNDPSVTSVKYEAGEGTDGYMSVDSLVFMLEGTEHDKMKVDLDYLNLSVEDITDQNALFITESLILTPFSTLNCAYNYVSSNEEILSNRGLVTRPEEDSPVTFTVTVSKGEFSKSKTYDFIIKKESVKNLVTNSRISSSEAVEGYDEENAIDGLFETEFITSAEEKFLIINFRTGTTFNKVLIMEAKNELGEYGVTGFTIDVSDDGKNWKPVYAGTSIGESKTVEFELITAKYIRYHVTSLDGTQTGLREFIVLYEPVPEVAVELDLKKVTIVPNNYNVTGDLTLMTEGEYGSVITWKSSHPDIITDDGRLISTPEKTTTIRLTATLTNGGFTRTKEFTLSVQGSSTGEDISGDNGGSEKPGGVSGGGSGGGSDDDEDPKPVDPTPVDPTPITPSVNTFKDVASDRWSYEYIMELKEAGIVSGDGENFRPTDKVTREEFVKMLVLSLGITPDGSADFSDVSSDAWHHDYIAVAVEKGIVQGISDTEFGIGRSISRQDMAVMTVRALQALQVELQGGEAPVFTDEHEIADYAGDAVKILAAAGILNGADGKFAPTDNLTREQAAKVLCMIRKELTK